MFHSGSGRKRDYVWNNFEEIISVSRKGKRAKCKSCGKEMEGQVFRLKCHAEVCEKLISDDNDLIMQVESNSEATGLQGPSAHIHEAQKDNVVKKVKNLPTDANNKGLIQSFVIKTSKNQKQILDEQVARYIYSTNSAFRTVENPQFVKLTEMLRPGYSPPTRQSIANELLDTVYEKERATSMENLEGTTVTLSVDGWSNIHNDPIVCTSITTEEGKTVLLDTFDTSGNPHTSEYLLQLVNQSIEKLDIKYQIQVGSVVTDNTGNVKKMRRLLFENDNTKNIITYGCCAHLLNLLMKDIQIPGVKERLLPGIKYFRNNHFAAAKYRETKKPKLPLPIDVRWNSFIDCMETYIDNWPTLMTICKVNREEIESNIYSTVLDLSLKRNIEDLILRMKPISVTLDKIQRSSATIADSVQNMKDLEKDLIGQKLPKKVIDKFNERKKQALSPAHYLANVLHPVYQGTQLSAGEIEMAMIFATEKSESESCPEFLTTLMKFRAHTGPFLQVLFQQSLLQEVNAVDWWKALRSQIHIKVFKIVLQLLTATASTASLERLLSTFGLVQSDLRNRLGNEKAGKLVFLMRYLNENI